MCSKVSKTKSRIIANCVSYPLEDVNAIVVQMEDEFRDIVKEYKMEQKLTIDRVKDILRHVLSHDDVLTYVVDSMSKEKENKKCHSVTSENPVTPNDDDDDELTEDGELMETPTKQSPARQKLLLTSSLPKNVAKSVDLRKYKISKSVRLSHSLKSRSPYKHRPHWRTSRSPYSFAPRIKSPFKSRLDIRESVRYKSHYSSPRKVFAKSSGARHSDERYMLESQEAQRKMYESRERGRPRSPHHSHSDKGYGDKGHSEFRNRHDHAQSKSVKRMNSASHEKTQEEDRIRVPKKLKVPEKMPKHQDKMPPKTNSLEKSELMNNDLNVVELNPVNAVATQKHENMLLTIAQKSVARFETTSKSQNDSVKESETAVSSSEPAKADSEAVISSTKVKNSSKVDVSKTLIKNDVIHAESKDPSPNKSSKIIGTGSSKITPSEGKCEKEKHNMPIVNDTCNEITSCTDVDMNDEVLEIKISESEKLEESPIKEIRRSPRKKQKNGICAENILLPSSSIKNKANIPENDKSNVSKDLNKKKEKKYVQLHRIESPKSLKKQKSSPKNTVVNASSIKKKTADSVKVSIKCVNVDSNGKVHVSGSDSNGKNSEVNAESESSKESSGTLKLHDKNAMLHENDESANILQNSVTTSISKNEPSGTKKNKSVEIGTRIESSEMKSPNKITKKSPSAALQVPAKEIHELSVAENKEPVSNFPVVESTKEQSSPKKVELKWTREEDKEILLTCRKYGSSQVAFQMAANASSNKTAEQVKERFFDLMEIYSKAMNKMSS